MRESAPHKDFSKLVPSRMSSDEGGATEKINRDEIRSLIGGESSVVEHAYFVVIAGEGVGRMIRLENEHYIGRDKDNVDIWFRDNAISKKHARVEAAGGRVVIHDLGSANGTYVEGKRIKSAELADGDRIVVGRSTVLKLTFQDELDEEFQQRMYESSTRDGLTGAYNKTTFFDQMSSELAYARRHNTNFCLVMFDIDHFKSINDTHGHLVGDEILRAMGDLVRAITRDESLFVRYGGEEFIIAERGADARMGAAIAERIRATVEGHEFETSGGIVNVTVSLGVSDLHALTEVDFESLLQTADQALYRAKEQGRNQVCVAEPVVVD